MEPLVSLWNQYLVHVVDILLVSYIIFHMLLLMRGTRAVQIAVGLVIVGVVTLLSQFLGFPTLSWLLQKFWIAGVVVLAVLFQPEIRSALANLGASTAPRGVIQDEMRIVNELVAAAKEASRRQMGMALAAQGVPAISLTGSQSGIITDGTHGRARIRRVLGTRIREGIAQGKVVIVAGFQGVSEQKEITTLGRGGSDTTAVALAAALGAEACEIYTDVDGVFSADPRRVPSARHWPEVPASLMLELAERGAGVLHPRCVEIARQFGVDLRVINSLREGTEKGTRVVKDQDTERLEEFRVLGVTCDEGKVPLMIELARPTALAALWDRAGSLPVVAPQFQAGQVMFFTDRDCEEEWAKRLSTLATDGFVRTYRFDLDQTPVSVVGTQFSQDSGALQNLIEILAQAEIPVTMGSVSALAATLAVPRSRAEEAVQLLHGKYFKPT